MSAGRPRARVYLTAEEAEVAFNALRFYPVFGSKREAVDSATQKLDRALARLNHNTKGAA